jgi:hypothetical protein
VTGGGGEIEGLERTVLRVGEADVLVTREGVKAMQVALLDYLRQQLHYEDRDELLRWSGGPAWIDGDGRARIGPWLLGSEGSEIYLRYREPPGVLAAKAHRATLGQTDAGGWAVTGLVMERIRVRR